MFGNTLTDEKINEIYDNALSACQEGEVDEAWKILKPLIEECKNHENAAHAVVNLAGEGYFSRDKAQALLSGIYESHKENDDIAIEIGRNLETVRDMDDLNAPPPDSQLFSEIIKRLSEIALANKGSEDETSVIDALSCVTRLMARQYDALAERSYARLVDLLPETAWAHYNQGLFFKTRGRFSEGVLANQKAINLNDERDESHQWNLGICATGADEGAIALKVWKDLGQDIELGRFNLPEGRYPTCKVRLAEHTLAERASSCDEPGLEETIWIERLSPCHGIIRSVLYQDLGVNYGDVILFDGAPITYHRYGDEQVAVFPHLSTLRRNNYRFYDFAGTQESNGELAELSAHLERDAVVYSHTESYVTLCSTCWRDEKIDHEHLATEEKHVVTGRIAAPPDLEPFDLLEQVDKQLKHTPANRIFSPQLCLAADLGDRARFEQARYDLLYQST